jgi:hypothetical protein
LTAVRALLAGGVAATAGGAVVLLSRSGLLYFFVARKGSPILRAAAEYALSELTVHGGSVNWVATSSWLQLHAIEHMYPWGYWMQIPTRLVEPVDVNAPEWLFEPPEGNEIERTKSFGFMTSFHAMRRLLPHSREELVASNTRLARILHRALKL